MSIPAPKRASANAHGARGSRPMGRPPPTPASWPVIGWCSCGGEQVSWSSRYQGRGPTSHGRTSPHAYKREAERSLGDESAGPLAQLIPYPRDAAGDGDDDDQLAPLKAGISAARGSALLVETTNAGLGDRSAAPQADWKPNKTRPAATGGDGVSRRSRLRPDAGGVRMQPGAVR